jgi:hypothetical protein
MHPKPSCRNKKEKKIGLRVGENIAFSLEAGEGKFISVREEWI